MSTARGHRAAPRTPRPTARAAEPRPDRLGLHSTAAAPPADVLLSLQRTIGNRAVSDLVRSAPPTDGPRDVMRTVVSRGTKITAFQGLLNEFPPRIANMIADHPIKFELIKYLDSGSEWKIEDLIKKISMALKVEMLDVLYAIWGTARSDDALLELYSKAVESNDTKRLKALAQIAESLPTIPEMYQRGKRFAKGGTSVLYAMENHPEFLVKAGGGRLSVESLGLLELEIAGFKTVYAGQRANEIIVRTIDGVGSKDVIGRQKQPKVDPEKARFVTDKTISDLQKIYLRLAELKMNVGDFQFIIQKSDGAVFLNDPVSVTLNSAPSGKIKAMIEKFHGINKRRKQGDYDK